jgi:hypothetical protein
MTISCVVKFIIAIDETLRKEQNMAETYDRRCTAHFNNAAIRDLDVKRAERAEKEYSEEEYVRLCSLPHLEKSSSGKWGCHWWYKYNTIGCYADTPGEAYMLLASHNALSLIARRYLLSKIRI